MRAACAVWAYLTAEAEEYSGYYAAEIRGASPDATKVQLIWVGLPEECAWDTSELEVRGEKQGGRVGRVAGSSGGGVR